MATIHVRIRRDGTVEAVTHGLKGDACLPYIERVEQLTGSTAVDSYYTEEFYEGRERVRSREEAEEVEQRRIDIGGHDASH
jgi:hypothetical protein